MKRLFPFFVTVLALPSLICGQEPEHENLNASGSVKAVGPGVLQMATAEGDMWVLKLEAKPEDVTFSGTAEKAFLRPGMNVEFRSMVNKRGMAPEPLAMLTVFTPSEGRPLGIQSDSDIGAGGGAGLFGEANEPKKKPARVKGEAKLKGDDTIYRVAGTISKIGRAGDITVSAGGAQVKANLAEECKISVELNDLSFVSEGDKVSVQGWFYKGRPGQGVAGKVEVAAANPLTDGSKKKPGKALKTNAKSEKGTKGAKLEKAEETSAGNKEAPKKDEKKGAE